MSNSSVDGRHDDDSSVSEFLASLMDYTPTIPDELVEHYVAKSGFQCPDVRLIRLVAVATQKFIAEVASDALQFLTTAATTFSLESLRTAPLLPIPGLQFEAPLQHILVSSKAGGIKICCDGASLGNPMVGGSGAVLKNNACEVVAVVVKNLQHTAA
ncbi:hypothetical protein GIB67_037181 [Kingdonia uniflora]|uniref:Transcription initiation factor TFIID subunit 10 n=1 Tax=Kingdonia uniflora TaxID=39325 RepID=A0A7J7MSD8_9MAGN|nr:hypothetical protein GIB67_037181 [Kingdonia uniflora]